MKKLLPKIVYLESGYCILTPIYAGVDGNYLSHWQQTSPYWWRLGYVKRFVERHIKDIETQKELLKQIEKIKNKKNEKYNKSKNTKQ